MWNGDFDALKSPNCAFADRGSSLKNNQFAVLHIILSVVGVYFGHPIDKDNCRTAIASDQLRTQATSWRQHKYLKQRTETFSEGVNEIPICQ